MEKHAWADKIILLFDSYSLESQYLHESFLQAGCDCVGISLEENDFLPYHIASIYELLSGEFQIGEENWGMPRFFNEIEVPDHWSVHAGDTVSGSVTYLHEEKGRVYYLPSDKRYLVEAVEWYDRKGRVRFRDLYNRYGNLCARMVYGANGQAYYKTRFTKSGQEAITENFVTGDIMLNDDGAIRLFRSKRDLILYWLVKKGFGKNRIFYNSLSTPFFLSNRLGGAEKKDILFWQEPVGQEIPGNMQMIFDGASGRTDQVMVQKRSAYEKLLELGADERKVHKLGFIYPFKKENRHRMEALICTNSDRIEHCEELIKTFPQMHFHIAAITTMSPKLMDLGNYKNVSLYPGAGKDVQDSLFQMCDFYFDINHRNEILSSVYQAFLHNHLIFAFQETVHNREYIAESQIYPAGQFGRMVLDIKAVLGDGQVMQQRLKKQQANAMAESRESYFGLLEL